jgi:branched-chain amino acid transport system ATP-binding protein
MLEVADLHVYYGHIHAVRGISFQVQEGEILALIGANGAGKSTTAKTIAGILKPRRGDVILRGRSTRRLRCEQIVGLGVGYVPEGRRVFPALSVDINLEVGAYSRKDRTGISQDKNRMYERFPVLGERRDQLAGLLSGGEQQMLAIARTLMSRPDLILMDEPSLGLSPVLVRHVFALVAELNEQGTTILLSEQNARAALGIAHHAVVLEVGQVALQGEAAELRQNAEVRRTYMGI